MAAHLYAFPYLFYYTSMHSKVTIFRRQNPATFSVQKFYAPDSYCRRRGLRGGLLSAPRSPSPLTRLLCAALPQPWRRHYVDSQI